MKIIARIHTDFKEKFGIPRQSGIINELVGRIVFEPEYRRKEAFRGLDGYSHLWIIWQFSEAVRDEWSPTVRPPRLGGNKRIGVFATRSPYRPNPIGLSSVKIEKIDLEASDGPIIYVKGADMLDGTPIYDIKPYLPFTDCHPDAQGGFADEVKEYKADVVFPDDLLEKIDTGDRKALISILENDPRPSYKRDATESYGMSFSRYEITFRAEDGRITVTDITVKN